LVPIGDHPDAAAYDAKRGLVYSSNGEGNLTVVRQDNADHYSVISTVPTQLGARTMALDSAGGKIYLVTAEFGPPPPATEAQPHPRPAIKPDSFVVLVIGATLQGR
jgi:DNA-binding beta-propeller fold protein YncE